MRLSVFGCALLICFLTGCTGSSTVSAPTSSAEATAAAAPQSPSTVQVDLSFASPPADEVVAFKVVTTDDDGFRQLIDPVTAARSLQGGTQRITLSNVPPGNARILLYALNAEGGTVGSYEQATVVVSGSQTLTFTELVLSGQTREIGLVSVGANGVQANGAANRPALSFDGRFVAFQSTATNLISGTPAGSQEILVRDRLQGTLARASISATGNILGGINADPDITPSGRFVAFRSGDVNQQGQVLRRDRGGFTEVISRGVILGRSVSAGSLPRMSTTGNVVVFQTLFDTTPQVVLRDVTAGTLELISGTPQNALGNAPSTRPCISNDGQIVVFGSLATNLIAGGTPGVYLRNRLTATTERLPVPANLTNTNITADGRFVLCSAPGEIPVLFDRTQGTAVSITAAPNVVGVADLSDDARFITFFSTNAQIIPNDVNGRADVFVHDRRTGITSRVNISNDGTSVFGGVDGSALASPVISGDGSRVAFASSDRALVPNNLSLNLDVYSANVPTPGKLYVSLGSTIQRFDDASIAVGTSAPSATLSGSATRLSSPGKLFLDAANDRLYVANRGAQNVLVFNAVSTKNGNVAPDRVLDAAVFFRVDDLFVDVSRNKLFTCGSSADVVSFDNASTLNGNLDATAHRQIRTASSPARAILIDDRLNELYVIGTEDNLNTPFVAVYENAGALSSTNPPVSRKLFGTTPFLQLVAPSSLAFDPIPPDFQGATANDASLLLVDQVNTVATFLSNGSRSGFLGNVAASSIVLGTSSVLIEGVPPKQTVTVPFAQIVVDSTVNARYLADAVAQSVQVFASGTTSSQPARVIKMPARPQGMALDRTR